MFIALAILAFSIIIAIHELGHFLSAKALNVKVTEFAIGMGPKLFSKQGKETLYSLRILPFGGFCNMEGEHEDVEDETGEPDPRAFLSQKRWRRIVILVSGSGANIIAALIIVFFLYIGATGFVGTTIADIKDHMPDLGPSQLMAGDRIVAVNGERLYYYDDFNLFMSINAGKPITFTIDRDGQTFDYERRSYTVEGETVYRYNIIFSVIENNLAETLKYSFYQMYSFIRMIRVSIVMLFSGAASFSEDIAGPVGIISAMNTVGREAPNIGAALGNIVFFTAFIGVNVAIINLLPIPAMDGGRILFIFITWAIEKITRRHLNPKYENYINTGAFFLLIGLMVIILYNDIVKLIR